MDKKRPVGVWLIFAWCLGGLAWLSFSHYMILSGRLPLTPAQQDFFNGLHFVDHVIIFSTSVYAALSAVMLFLRKKASVRLFQGLLVLVPVIWGIDICRRGFGPALGTGGYASLAAAILGYLIDISMCVYVARLQTGKYFSKS